jgi:hypothetical protein
MRSLVVLSAVSLRSSRFIVACLATLVAATGLVGCDAPSAPNGLPLPTGIVVPKTPEEKLERVMERMQEALQDAQAARGTGVVSERTCEHRLIPPAEEGGKYMAEVTIRTKLSLANAPAAATLPPSDEEEAKGEEGEESDEAFAAAEEETAEGEETTPDNGVTRKAIALSRDQKDEVYQLAYEGDRWKLVSEPKNETDKLILDFALGN